MSDRLVTMATFNDPVEAALARNLLENEGIPALLMDESSVATDWLLSNAIGGIKLQVSLRHLERAELLLLQVSECEDDEESSAAPLATCATSDALHSRHREIEADLRAEEIDQSPCNQLVDRLFRATILGFLFIPVQFYALYLLLLVFEVRKEVSPDRRWKIWASILLNLPLMGVLLLLLAFLLSFFHDN